MQLKNYNVYFFFALLIGVSVLIYVVVKPFLVPFVIAIILVQIFYSVYEKLLKITRNKRGISSGLTCFLIALIIIVPLFFIATLVVQEARMIITNFSAGAPTIESVAERINGHPLLKELQIENLISPNAVLSFIRSVSQNTLSIIQGTYRGMAHLVFVSFILFFSMFYLFIDGKKFLKAVMKFSPLKDKYEERLMEKFTSIARATLKGTSLLAIIQGIIGSLLFLATGVSSPILLGILMTISSVIPPAGSGLVWLPVGLIMILLGHTGKGLIILLVGGLLIGTVDNILRQKLIGRDAEMHPLLILLSTLGGLGLFGIAGFIIGPIIMALFLALWEIYFFEFKEQLEEFNK